MTVETFNGFATFYWITTPGPPLAAVPPEPPTGLRLLPAAAERAIQLDHGLQLLKPKLRQRKLAAE